MEGNRTGGKRESPKAILLRGPRKGDERWGGDGGVKLRGRGHASLGAARGASWVSGGAGRPGAGAPDLKSRMFGWGLSSPNKQSTTLFKTEGHTGEGPGHLISISPPQGSATSYLEGPADRWGGRQQQGPGLGSSCHPSRGYLGTPHLAGHVGQESCQLTPSSPPS